MCRVAFLAAASVLVAVGQLPAQCPCHQRSRGISLQIWNERGARGGFEEPWRSRNYGYAPYNTSPCFGSYVDRQARQLPPPEVFVEVNDFTSRQFRSFQPHYETDALQFSAPLQFRGSHYSPCPNGLCPLR